MKDFMIDTILAYEPDKSIGQRLLINNKITKSNEPVENELNNQNLKVKTDESAKVRSTDCVRPAKNHPG